MIEAQRPQGEAGRDSGVRLQGRKKASEYSASICRRVSGSRLGLGSVQSRFCTYNLTHLDGIVGRRRHKISKGWGIINDSEVAGTGGLRRQKLRPREDVKGCWVGWSWSGGAVLGSLQVPGCRKSGWMLLGRPTWLLVC